MEGKPSRLWIRNMGTTAFAIPNQRALYMLAIIGMRQPDGVVRVIPLRLAGVGVPGEPNTPRQDSKCRRSGAGR